MPVSFDIRAVERSTYIVHCVFADEDGTPTLPATDVQWTLTDQGGSTVYGSGSITAAPEVDIVLTDDVLRFPENSASAIRVLLVETTYDSTLGSGLALKDSAEFVLDNLVAVAP